ncbi:unnamed protein product, partial [Cochlearia groenlandica]
ELLKFIFYFYVLLFFLIFSSQKSLQIIFFIHLYENITFSCLSLQLIVLLYLIFLDRHIIILLFCCVYKFS